MREPQSYLDTLSRREACRQLLDNANLSDDERDDVRACIETYTAQLGEIRRLDKEENEHRERERERAESEARERERAEAEARERERAEAEALASSAGW